MFPTVVCNTSTSNFMSPFAAPTHCMQQYYSHQVKYQRIDGLSEVEKRLPVIPRSRVASNLRAEEVWAIILEHSVAYWRQSGPSGEAAVSKLYPFVWRRQDLI